MSPIKSYKILTSPNTFTLETAILEYAALGYHLVGGPLVTMELDRYNNHVFVFHQAMALYAPHSSGGRALAPLARPTGEGQGEGS